MRPCFNNDVARFAGIILSVISTPLRFEISVARVRVMSQPFDFTGKNQDATPTGEEGEITNVLIFHNKM